MKVLSQIADVIGCNVNDYKLFMNEKDITNEILPVNKLGSFSELVLKKKRGNIFRRSTFADVKDSVKESKTTSFGYVNEIECYFH